MNTKKYLTFVNKLLKFFIFLFSIGLLYSQSQNGIHIRTGVWNPENQYKFNDVDQNIGYITAFPIDKIEEEFSEDILQNWRINYGIFTSIDEAELAMVERLDMSHLWVLNMIDSPLPNGNIGDNCWYRLPSGVIQFIRNNVLVLITAINVNDSTDTEYVEHLARKIDTLLVESDKVKYTSFIHAPLIQSVEITSDLPENWDSTVKVKVNAMDQKAQKLFYRKYASGFALVSEDGNLSCSLNKNTDLTDNPHIAKIKIWVWNEDYVTSSIYADIPF